MDEQYGIPEGFAAFDGEYEPITESSIPDGFIAYDGEYDAIDGAAPASIDEGRSMTDVAIDTAQDAAVSVIGKGSTMLGGMGASYMDIISRINPAYIAVNKLDDWLDTGFRLQSFDELTGASTKLKKANEWMDENITSDYYRERKKEYDAQNEEKKKLREYNEQLNQQAGNYGEFEQGVYNFLGGVKDAVGSYIDNPYMGFNEMLASIPAMLPVSKASQVARAATIEKSTRGLTPELKQAWIQSDIGKKVVDRASERAAAAMVGVTEGGSNAFDTKATVLESKHEDLMKTSPVYQELYKKYGNEERAKMELSNKAHDAVAFLSGISGGLASKITGAAKFEGDLFTRGSRLEQSFFGRVIKEGTKGTLAEAPEEGMQGASGQFSQNLANKMYVDENQSLMEDVGSSAAQGIILGGGSGLVMGAGKGALSGSLKSVEDEFQAIIDEIDANNDANNNGAPPDGPDGQQGESDFVVVTNPDGTFSVVPKDQGNQQEPLNIDNTGLPFNYEQDVNPYNQGNVDFTPADTSFIDDIFNQQDTGTNNIPGNNDMDQSIIDMQMQNDEALPPMPEASQSPAPVIELPEKEAVDKVGKTVSFKTGRNQSQGTVVSIEGDRAVIQTQAGKTVKRKLENLDFTDESSAASTATSNESDTQLPETEDTTQKPEEEASAQTEQTSQVDGAESYPNYEQGLKTGWNPVDAKTFAKRYGAVVNRQDPLSARGDIDKIVASRESLPQQIVKFDPILAQEIANELRRDPEGFSKNSGSHPDYASVLANEIERQIKSEEKFQEILKNNKERAENKSAANENPYILPIPSFVEKKAVDINGDKTYPVQYEVESNIKKAQGRRDQEIYPDNLESTIELIESHRKGVDELNGRLNKGGKAGFSASPKEMMAAWVGYHQLSNSLEDFKKNNPDVWAAYQQRQESVKNAEPGDKLVDPYGNVYTLTKKNKVNYSLKTEGGSSKLLSPKVLKPLEQNQSKQEDTAKPGKKEKVITPKGTEVEVQFEVVELDDVMHSGKEGYNQEFQPRKRGRIGSKQQIQKILNNFDPLQLTSSRTAGDGSPIIDEDNMALTGNGRMGAIEQLYQNNDNVYKQYLTDNADEFGIDVTGFKQPVLVRRLLSETDKVKFANEANIDTKLSMSPAEQAVNDAENILDEALLSKLADSDFLSSRNRDFIRGFLANLSEEEQNKYITQDGLPNSSLINRIRAAVLHKAYGNATLSDRVSELTDDDQRNTINALINLAPKFARAINTNPQHKPIVGKIAAGAVLYINFRRNNTTVAAQKAQQNMFDDVDQDAMGWAEYFEKFARSRVKIESGLGIIADDLYNDTNSMDDMFGDKQSITNQSALRRANETVEGTQQQDELFGPTDTATSGTEQGVNKESDRQSTTNTVKGKNLKRIEIYYLDDNGKPKTTTAEKLLNDFRTRINTIQNLIGCIKGV